MSAKEKPRRGSSMSDKEIAYSVRKGQQVQFKTTAGVVNGYVCGMDDFHWKIIDNSDPDDITITLVHRSSPIVRILSDPSLENEGNSEALEKIIAPFRDFVMKEFFQSGKDPAPTNRPPERGPLQ